MLKYCLSLVTFSFLFCVTQQLGGFLAGGRLTLSKEEFNKNYANLFIPAINEKLVSYARKSGENQNPKKFYSFVCGTKQVCIFFFFRVKEKQISVCNVLQL